MNEFIATIDGLSVSVDKVGGGTVGRDYTGMWMITVKNGDAFVYNNDMMSTSIPRSHEDVAAIAADFASAAINHMM